ncbi:MAG: inorganic phosphate transporter [Ignavibacteriae bacterium]|nr:inorganic phosphate transporter [Ignavibacteriota bacterium]
MFELTLFIILIALLFDFLNGMNDAANSIATVVATRVLTPKIAVLWAAFFNFAAAFGFGVHVANTIGKGIVVTEVVDQYIILSALIGAVIWTHGCTKYGFPISVSHSLIGGLAGAAIIKAGFNSLISSGIIKVTIFIFLSPIIGLILGSIFMIAVTWIFRNSSNRKVDKVFKIGQLISSAAFSLGHGTNDAQKTMGIISILLFTNGYLGSEFYVPFWVVIISHTAIGLGTLAGGWKVIQTMGMKLTHLKPVGGFCAETAGAVVLVGTALAGIPVSTTHTITGSVMGVGIIKRLTAVKWGIAGKIIWAWVLTIPISGLCGALAYLLISLFL